MLSSGGPPEVARTGLADLPLHGGRCPRWLFERMKQLSSTIVEAIVLEFGAGEVLRRLSDPYWFQAFGCVLGFDWHSSGLTTTVTGALKAGLLERGCDVGIFVAGGKGGASRKTPVEIELYADKYALTLSPDRLAYASRMAAKVDSAALQDGFTLYHHVFIFSAQGEWAVIQQGMQEKGHWARRYHWLGETVTDFVAEPHAAVCCDLTVSALNMVAEDSRSARQVLPELLGDDPEPVLADYRRLLATIDNGSFPPAATGPARYLSMPAAHPVPNARRLEQTLRRIYDCDIDDFESLLALPGVGAQTIRALAMVAEVIHGVPSSFSDPVRYSFAHGGKDGHPYPVNRRSYDHSIAVLSAAIEQARLGGREKLEALRRLARFAKA